MSYVSEENKYLFNKYITDNIFYFFSNSTLEIFKCWK